MTITIAHLTWEQIVAIVVAIVVTIGIVIGFIVTRPGRNKR